MGRRKQNLAAVGKAIRRTRLVCLSKKGLAAFFGAKKKALSEAEVEELMMRDDPLQAFFSQQHSDVVAAVRKAGT